MAHPAAKLWLRALLLAPLACDLDVAEPLSERSRDRLFDARTSEVIFSPQPPDATHNIRIAELIDSADASIDIAIYGLGSAAIEAALRDAAARGVAIRLLYEGAKDDQRLDADARASSQSAALEAAGIDVRYVNKIMHHKFMIVDGPRDDLDEATTATLVTGSANWSGAAAARYDENTLFLRGHVELVLRMQGEFNLLWEHSRDFVSDAAMPLERSAVAITDQDIVDGGDTHALFTSSNFEVVGDTTFTATGRSMVSDALIDAIAGASYSIRVASGHLRDRGIANALMVKARQDPEMDIRVYLDAQEWVSAATLAAQLEELRECVIATMDDAAARSECLDRGYRFGAMIERAGVDVRYKWYSYRWTYIFAEQMHHKYLIIDGDELWTGSYNLSNNAEHNSMENMLVFSGPEHTKLIRAYTMNFERLWITGRADRLLERLRERIRTADVVPLRFEPMALEWDEVRDLKALIRENCPWLSSSGFHSESESHEVCHRSGPARE